MTELEQLSNFIAFYNREKENVGYTGLNNWLDEFGPGFLSSLRNNDSSADNTSDEQLHSDEELMSKIEDIALELADNFAEGEYRHKIDETSYFQKHTRKQFAKAIQTRRNTVSTAVKQQDDNLLSQEDLLSKMDSLIWDFANDFTCCNQDQEFYFVEDFKSELIKLFKNCLSPVFRALNDSDEQSIIK